MRSASFSVGMTTVTGKPDAIPATGGALGTGGTGGTDDISAILGGVGGLPLPDRCKFDRIAPPSKRTGASLTEP
jgi:hypothetical protein